MPRKRSHIGRKLAAAALVLAVAALGLLGWQWLDGLVVQQVTVDGTRHADGDDVLAVARVDTGVRLLDVDPDVIADRAARHPWVRAAEVHRLPPGVVSIDVEERVPVALAISERGYPDVYLDRLGYPLPLVDGADYDVPLIHGVSVPANRTQPVESGSVLELLASLADLDPSIDLLVSSFDVAQDGEITLHTAPAGSQSSVEVRLGRRGYTQKFRTLKAFWTQAVLSRPEKTFATIDLRFDGQIVTHES